MATTDMTDFDKIGVNVLKCKQEKGRWVFEKDGKLYDMAPANFTEYVLGPLIVGADRLINLGCQQKNIKEPQKGFYLLFSQNYFPNADVQFEYVEQKFDGWVYKIIELNLNGIIPGQSAWICPYLNSYFLAPPNMLYIKMEGMPQD